ncbi:MAG: hypothetical protein QW226_00415 [Archaeoglobaceae archaeon]
MRLILLTLLLITPVSAISVSYELSPEIVLPNGYADCLIRISNPNLNSTNVYSISFYSSTVEILPSSISVGKIAPQSSYTFKVSMKSQIVGRHVVEMQIFLENESITIPIELVVDDKFPQVAIVSPLYKSEVKNARIAISSPVTLRDLRIEALFNATPKVHYVGTLSGAEEVDFKFSEEIEELHFKISFYNGKSYHEIKRSLKANYLESKGLATNLQLSRDVLFTGEAVNLTLEITNLRNDEVYLIEVNAVGNGKFARDYAKIEKLGVGEKKLLNFLFSPRESGKVELRISYYDYFGSKHEIVESTSIEVLEAKALQIVNLRTESALGKTKISGEIVNYGYRSALSVGVSAFCNDSKADYFIGEIKANDYETFDLEVSCRNATLELSWWNEAGERFTTLERVEVKVFKAGESYATQGNTTPLLIAIIASIAVVAFVIYVALRHRK